MAARPTPGILQRIGITITASVSALRNPYRQDMVAALGESTGLGALSEIRDRMLLDPVGRRILRNQPMIHSSTIDLSKLSNLPQNTFGFQYVNFLQSHNISPDTRLDVQYVGDQELAYVMTRYRQIHDFWHVLTELPTTVEAEIGLKCFEYFQTGLPMTALSVMFGPLNTTPDQRNKIYSQYIPWALQCANTSKDLMNVYYEELFDLPFDKVQKSLGIIPAPKF
jgi:ubiquinone biosynthesis protein COQ4